MKMVSRRFLCGFLSLLLLSSGQLVMAAQTLAGEDAAMTVMAGSGCGQLSGGPGALESGPAQGCGDPDSMTCLMSPNQCATAPALASAPFLTFSESRCHDAAPAPFLTYQSPVLDITTPPPDFYS